jgi:hypothetical protein
MYLCMFSATSELITAITECSAIGIERIRTLAKLVGDISGEELKVIDSYFNLFYFNLFYFNLFYQYCQTLSDYTGDIRDLDAAEKFLVRLIHIEK